MAKSRKKTLQLHSDESLSRAKKLTAEQVIEFLESFRSLHDHSSQSPSKLISIKIPENLLKAFRLKAEQKGVKYQTQIKALMKEWLSE